MCKCTNDRMYCDVCRDKLNLVLRRCCKSFVFSQYCKSSLTASSAQNIQCICVCTVEYLILLHCKTARSQSQARCGVVTCVNRQCRRPAMDSAFVVESKHEMETKATIPIDIPASKTTAWQLNKQVQIALPADAWMCLISKQHERYHMYNQTRIIQTTTHETAATAQISCHALRCCQCYMTTKPPPNIVLPRSLTTY